MASKEVTSSGMTETEADDEFADRMGHEAVTLQLQTPASLDVLARDGKGSRPWADLDWQEHDGRMGARGRPAQRRAGTRHAESPTENTPEVPAASLAARVSLGVGVCGWWAARHSAALQGGILGIPGFPSPPHENKGHSSTRQSSASHDRHVSPTIQDGGAIRQNLKVPSFSGLDRFRSHLSVFAAFCTHATPQLATNVDVDDDIDTWDMDMASNEW